MLSVLLVIHHQLDANFGASGATLKLGKALEKAGCNVEYYSMTQAFKGKKTGKPVFSILFPWKLAFFLKKRAVEFDIIDVSTGDNWIWALVGRLGRRKSQALITRSHGLEHTVDAVTRGRIKKGELSVSWKYFIYHGGFRLWEVKKSLLIADHVFLLNEQDKDYSQKELGVAESKIDVLPNGVNDDLLGLPVPIQNNDGKLHLAYVGGWISDKGSQLFSRVIEILFKAGVDLQVSILGCSMSREDVLRDIDVSMHEKITVIPRFNNVDLPKLLIGHELLIFLSFVEGFSLALVEAMACGLAPIATPVGGAPGLIRSGENGVLVPIGDAEASANFILQLYGTPDMLLEMRRAAQKTAQSYNWDAIAEKTIDIYKGVLEL